MDPRHGSIPCDTESYPGETSTAARALQDIAFGSFAGIVSELFEYPFDLAKVRLQGQVLDTTAARFTGPWDCLKQTWTAEGVRGLYRGLPIPIVGSMAETAALFLGYAQLQNVIRWSSNTHPSEELSIQQLGLAAGGAGFLTSFILTPIELVKCKMQVQMITAPYRGTTTPTTTRTFHPPLPLPSSLLSSAHIRLPTPNTLNGTRHQTSSSSITKGPPGPLSIVSSIIKTHGIRGLWLGHSATMVRETGGTAVWFASKEFIASQLVARRRKVTPGTFGSPKLSSWESALSGALSGAICVLALYPVDTIKSAVQTSEDLNLFPNRKNKTSVGFIEMGKAMFRARGLHGLFAGCGMTVARAIPGSGIVFVVYDGLTQRFGSDL